MGIKEGRVRYRYPYQTRHSYASMMLSAGERPMRVARQMGHANWTMITREYGKWMPDADKLAVAAPSQFLEAQGLYNRRPIFRRCAGQARLEQLWIFHVQTRVSHESLKQIRFTAGPRTEVVNRKFFITNINLHK